MYRHSIKVQFSQETRFLFKLCAEARGFKLKDSWMTESPSTDITESPLNWDAFLDSANRHKVAGLTYRALIADKGLQSDQEFPPATTLSRLKRRASATAALRSMLVSEWGKLEVALRAAGVRSLILKGPALSMQLFGDPLIREYKDIDLLVDSEDFTIVEQVFQDLDYEYTPEIPKEDSPHRDFLLRGLRHRSFKKRGFPCYFEVHQRRKSDIGLSPLPIEEAFLRAECLVFNGIPFPALGRSDHALLVLIHGAHHGWCQLQWVLDAAKLLRDPAISLQMETPKTWRGEDPVYCLDSFRSLCHTLFESPFSETASIEQTTLSVCKSPLSERRRRRASRLSAMALQNLPSGGACLYTGKPLFQHNLVYLPGLVRGWMRKIGAIAPIFFKPNPLDIQSIGRGRLPLFFYSLARPFLVAARKCNHAFVRPGTGNT